MILHELFLVVSRYSCDTFHVISGKINCLWDSVAVLPRDNAWDVSPGISISLLIFKPCRQYPKERAGHTRHLPRQSTTIFVASHATTTYGIDAPFLPSLRSKFFDCQRVSRVVMLSRCRNVINCLPALPKGIFFVTSFPL